jgi:hypothetical protein
MSPSRSKAIAGLADGDAGSGDIESLVGGVSAICPHSACRGWLRLTPGQLNELTNAT